MKFYLSTIAPDAAAWAKKVGLGLELAEFCTAWNMDDQFRETDAQVQQETAGITHRLLHAPFNELFPCAIDRRARALAAARYRQAIGLARDYGATKVIIHGGFQPQSYYPVWYVEESIRFWQDFLQEDPGIELVLENVLETDPAWLVDIVRSVNSPRLRLCLDVGHANAYSTVPLEDWLIAWAPWLSHLHLHNNRGEADTHNALFDGDLPMERLLIHIDALCPEVTATLEVMEAEPNVAWLRKTGFLPEI